MNVDIAPFNPQSATREEWDRYHVYRRLRHEEQNPGDPITGDTNAEALLKRPDPMGDSLRFVVVEEGKPEIQIGWIEFEVLKEGSPSYEGNEQLAIAEIALLESHRRHGVGRRLLAKVSELATKHGKSKLIGFSSEEDGKTFARALGAEVALEGMENRLQMDEIDWEMVETWAREGPERSPQSTVSWFRNAIDDAVIDDYCEFYTKIFNQQPFGALDFEDIVFTPEVLRDREARIADVGGTRLTAITTEKDGDISGMTEMIYMPDREKMIGQGLTGVKDTYRGRGLGKWLKAAMLLEAHQEFPQVTLVTTGNATTNEAMLSINRRLGFKRHKETESFQIALADIDRYLAK